MKLFLMLVASCLLILLFGWVGNQDLEFEVRSEAHYCDMVEQKVWPDYKNSYKYCNQAYEALAKLEGEIK